jgi:hypothetical protein
MKIRHILFSMPILMAACSSGFVIPDPVPGGKPTQPSNPSDEEEDTPIVDEPPQELKEGMLYADGNDEGTYELILSRGYNMEPPDNSGAHASAPWRHIRQHTDDILKRPVFDFYIHVENDDDRGKPEITDRQRNEIKTDGKSPAALVAQEGETLRISWKFRLPEGFQTTTNFCHIHQLKGIDNSDGTADVGMPLITFTCRSLSSGGQQFQVIHVGRTEDNASNNYLKKVNLADFLGEWVTVTETVKFAKNGRYQLVIYRMSDGRKLVELDKSGLDLWRTGTTGLRPKWGIYRSLGKNHVLAPQLRDEVLNFADFYIEKLAN